MSPVPPIREDEEMVLSPPRVVPTAEDRALADRLPLSTRFELGTEITGVQQAFLDIHGYILFSQVAASDEVARILAEIDAVQAQWIAEGREAINGIPLWIGEDETGAPFIQRFAFASLYSAYIRKFVRDDRFLPVRSLIGERTRVGDEEKDGVVFNRNLRHSHSAYSQLGWHTDGLRDLFMLHPNRPYVRPPGPMLNVGLHFDYIRALDGGLRLIPGSHRQGFRAMLLSKPYFISHRPDPREIAIETRPGDLTVHDGRMWHRVARSPHVGRRSLRRTMYVPYLVDTRQVKNESSGTPFYHRLNQRLGRIFRAG